MPVCPFAVAVLQVAVRLISPPIPSVGEWRWKESINLLEGSSLEILSQNLLDLQKFVYLCPIKQEKRHV